MFLHLLDGHAFADCVYGQRASELMRMYPTNLRFLPQRLDPLLDCADAQPLCPPIERLTLDFGKGFDPSNLRYMRLFYQAFPICDALRHELSWTHYRRLSRISDPDARMWYMNECADAKWSTRQLERQTNTMFRERLLASKDKEPVSAASARLQVVDNCLGDFVVLSRLERDAAGVHGEYVAKLKRVVLVLGDDMHV